MNKYLLLPVMALILTACSHLQTESHHNNLSVQTNNTTPTHSTNTDWQELSRKILSAQTKDWSIEALPVHNGGLRIILPSSVIQTNNLDSKANSVLKAIAKKITNNSALRARIVGHTANDKENQIDQLNSLHLAYRTAERLIKFDVPSSRIQVEGRGNTDPLVVLDSPKSKKINRRIEIYLYQAR